MYNAHDYNTYMNTLASRIIKTVAKEREASFIYVMPNSIKSKIIAFPCDKTSIECVVLYQRHFIRLKCEGKTINIPLYKYESKLVSDFKYHRKFKIVERFFNNDNIINGALINDQNVLFVCKKFDPLIDTISRIDVTKVVTSFINGFKTFMRKCNKAFRNITENMSKSMDVYHCKIFSYIGPLCKYFNECNEYITSNTNVRVVTIKTYKREYSLFYYSNKVVIYDVKLKKRVYTELFPINKPVKIEDVIFKVYPRLTYDYFRTIMKRY